MDEADRCDVDMTEEGEELTAREGEGTGSDLERCPIRGGGPDMDEAVDISSGGPPPPEEGDMAPGMGLNPWTISGGEESMGAGTDTGLP